MDRMSAFAGFAWPCLLLVVAGCTGAADPRDAAGGAVREGSLGVVQIRRGDIGERVGLGAVFARYQGIEGPAVLDLLGAEHAHGEPDTCSLATADDAFGADDATVELLDAGSVAVELGGPPVVMAPRTYPALGRLASGVFYAADVAPAPDVGTQVRVRSTGGADVARFAFVTGSPPPPSRVLVAGVDAEDAPQIDRARDLDVGWDAGEVTDRVAIDLRVGGHVLSCLARDDGHLQISRDLVGQLDAELEAHLVLSRVRQEPFEVAGVDVAWVSLESRRSVSVAVR